MMGSKVGGKGVAVNSLCAIVRGRPHLSSIGSFIENFFGIVPYQTGYWFATVLLACEPDGSLVPVWYLLKYQMVPGSAQPFDRFC